MANKSTSEKYAWYFFNSVLLFCVMSSSLLAQKSTFDNYEGDWNSAASWTDGVASTDNGIGGQDIDINGYITRRNGNKNLVFASANNAYDFTVNDTLVVMGSMSFSNKAMNLIIPSGGLLIVFGNFNADNKITIGNGGLFVVMGNMNFSNSPQDEYIDTGGGELYVNGTIRGNAQADAADEPISALSGTGDSGYDKLFNFLSGGGTTTLPIELKYLKAKTTLGGVQVNWASITESNFSHYLVERSTDGAKTFKEVAKVKAEASESTAEKEYSWIDTQPYYGANYYRLRAVDLDGSEEIHGLTVAYVGTDGAFKVSPNPANVSKSNVIKITYPGAALGTTLKIINGQGVEVMQIPLTEINTILPISSFSPGVYILQTQNGLETKSTRLIVQK